MPKFADFFDYDIKQELYDSVIDQHDLIEKHIGIKFISTSTISNLSELFVEWYLMSECGSIPEFLEKAGISHCFTETDFHTIMHGEAYLDDILLDYVREKFPIKVSMGQMRKYNRHYEWKHMVISAPNNLIDEIKEIGAGKKETLRKKRAEYVKERYANLTPEEKEERYERIRALIASYTPERKAAIRKYKAEWNRKWWAGLSEKERCRFRDKKNKELRERRRNDREWAEKNRTYKREQYQNLPKYREMIKKNSKKKWHSMSDEERQDYYDKRSERNRNMTREQKDERNRKNNIYRSDPERRKKACEYEAKRMENPEYRALKRAAAKANSESKPGYCNEMSAVRWLRNEIKKLANDIADSEITPAYKLKFKRLYARNTTLQERYAISKYPVIIERLKLAADELELLSNIVNQGLLSSERSNER